jgi:hypothetical protein
MCNKGLLRVYYCPADVGSKPTAQLPVPASMYVHAGCILRVHKVFSYSEQKPVKYGLIFTNPIPFNVIFLSIFFACF